MNNVHKMHILTMCSDNVFKFIFSDYLATLSTPSPAHLCRQLEIVVYS